jgi:protease-4
MTEPLESAEPAAPRSPQAATAESSWERSALEKIAMAALAEQRQARRWRNGLRLAWLLFFIALTWFGLRHMEEDAAN